MGKSRNPALKPTCGGQIARIYLENFMTYDTIEIRPGYHLNLIIGPNGTGKSSIVCAVLLGLGGKPKTLGRADQLGSYVKSGCDQSLIEIELHDPSEKSVVIRRQIASNNQSQFFVDGNYATVAKVNEIRKKYNIQIDNLCTFLPQEKVQDFAKLNPQQLLEQTERTVGHGDLVNCHEELKQLQASAIENEKHCKTLEEDLASEKEKNARLEDKVKSINEKRSLHEKVALLNQKKSWLCYHEEVNKKKEIERDFQLAQKNFDEKKRKHDKYSSRLKRLEDNIKSFQERVVKTKREENGKKAIVEDRQKRLQHKIENYEDLRNNVEAKLAEEQGKRQEMRRYEVNVDKLTNDLQTAEAEIGSEEQVRASINEVTQELNRHNLHESQLSQRKADLEEEEMHLQHEARNVESELRLLEQKRNARLEHLKRTEQHVYRAYQWLQQNRGIFQGHIFNPMMLELDVPNPKMAKYIESRISYRDLISFVCTNAEDLNMLVKKLRTEQNLRINAVCSEDDKYTQYSPEYPMAQLKQYGFYAYLRDVLTGPPPIISYLCKTYRIHNIPIGDESTKANSDKVPDRIRMFYSDNHVFNVKYSAYSGDKSTSVRKLGAASIFSASTDEGKVRHLQDRKQQIAQEINSKRSQIRKIDEEIQSWKNEVEKIRKKRRDLATTLDERTRILSQLTRARRQVEDIRRTLKSREEIEAEAQMQRNNLKKEIERSVENLKEAHTNLDKVAEARRQAEIIFRNSRFGIDDLMEKRQACAEDMSRAREVQNQMQERMKVADTNCRRLKEAARQLTNGISIGERGFRQFEAKFAGLKDTVEELEAEIEETQTMADFLQGGSTQVLQEYERREQLIAQIETNLDKCKADLERKKSRLAEKRESWIVPVTELVQKINTNFGNFFTTMGCAGEVELTSGENPDDFNHYGIKISVKFRDNVALQELGRYFQSGGERAVATAIYMLSLQELTSVPFRFVDEINQGMDPANERRIVELIVRVTSPVQSSQYFFITPKILPKIACPETMSVICIHNGPAAIPASEWDLRTFMRRWKGIADNDENGR